MSKANLTLKERVEKLEKIVEELTLIIQKISFKTIGDLEEKIQKTIQSNLEHAKTELWEEKKKAEAELYYEQEVIIGILEILEKELGVNVVLLQRKIKKGS